MIRVLCGTISEVETKLQQFSAEEELWLDILGTTFSNKGQLIVIVDIDTEPVDERDEDGKFLQEHKDGKHSLEAGRGTTTSRFDAESSHGPGRGA